MTFKSRTPKKDECITPMRCITFNKGMQIGLDTDLMSKNGIELIAEERQRQIDKEGFDSEHDSHNSIGELVLAASCYLGYEYPHWAETVDLIPIPKHFPWDKKWWKPTPNDRIRELTKAGALIAAEIDRLKNLRTKDKNV